MEPSLNEWKKLYDAAAIFKELKPWEWMWDSDLFAVENPENGEIGYCCVMGALGEMFALSVYLGIEGLEAYFKIQEIEISEIEREENINILYNQRSLTVSFEDKQFLEYKDLSIINKLNLKFSGKNNWPLFRSYQPGKRPWYLTAEEVRFLTICLQQTVEVALMAKNNPDFVFSTNDGLYFARVVERDRDVLKWRNTWVSPNFIKNRQDKKDTKLDSEKIIEIKQKIKVSSQIWEIDYSYFNASILESPDGKPWYPYVTLWVESNSGFVLSFLLSDFEEHKNIEKYKEKMLSHTLEIILKSNSIPGEIRVRKEEVLELFKPLAKELDIRLYKKEKLKMLDEASRSLNRFISRK